MFGDEILPRLLGDRRRAFLSLRDKSLHETCRELAIRLDERRRRLRWQRRHLRPTLELRSAPSLAREELRNVLDERSLIAARHEGTLDVAVLEDEVVHGVVGDDLHRAVKGDRH